VGTNTEGTRIACLSPHHCGPTQLETIDRRRTIFDLPWIIPVVIRNLSDTLIWVRRSSSASRLRLTGRGERHWFAKAEVVPVGSPPHATLSLRSWRRAETRLRNVHSPFLATRILVCHLGASAASGYLLVAYGSRWRTGSGFVATRYILRAVPALSRPSHHRRLRFRRRRGPDSHSREYGDEGLAEPTSPPTWFVRRHPLPGRAGEDRPSTNRPAPRLTRKKHYPIASVLQKKNNRLGDRDDTNPLERLGPI